VQLISYTTPYITLRVLTEVAVAMVNANLIRAGITYTFLVTPSAILLNSHAFRTANSSLRVLHSKAGIILENISADGRIDLSFRTLAGWNCKCQDEDMQNNQWTSRCCWDQIYDWTDIYYPGPNHQVCPTVLVMLRCSSQIKPCKIHSASAQGVR
jgi:hypothetical protein